MTSRDFCFWLQGFFELTASGRHPEDGSLTSVQGDAIRRHLALVFKHEIDPSMGPPAHQMTLDAIHVGDAKPTGATTEAVPHWQRPQDPVGPTFRC